MESPNGHQASQALLDGILRPLEPFFADRAVENISVNSDGSVWVDNVRQEHRFTSFEVTRALNAIATITQRTLNDGSPHISVGGLHLYGGLFRATGAVPPVAPSATLTLRRLLAQTFPPRAWSINPSQWEALLAAFGGTSGDTGLLIVGPQGSGKTTLLYSLFLEHITRYPLRRHVLIQDAAEIHPPKGANVVSLNSRPTPGQTLRDLIALSLRLDCHKIHVGELRDSTVVDLLNAWSSGHAGAASFHASTPESATLRLADLARQRFPDYDLLPTLAARLSAIATLTVNTDADGRKVRKLHSLTVPVLSEAGLTFQLKGSP